MFLAASEYQRLASEVGFSQITIEVEDTVSEWKNLDVFIDVMYGTFHGEFDPAEIDSDTLCKLKEDITEMTQLSKDPVESSALFLQDD